MLDAFYNNPQRWTFTLQMGILNSLYDQFRQMKELSSSNAVILMERNPASSKIFAEICKRDGFMSNEEFKIYQGCFEKLIWEPHLKLFINTNVSTCMERIARRGRECEKDIEHTYLEKLAEGYAKYSFDAYFSGSEKISTIANNIIQMECQPNPEWTFRSGDGEFEHKADVGSSRRTYS